MEELLKIDFTSHYNLPASVVSGISQETNEPYFEIEDDRNKGVQVLTLPNSGTAKYNNRKNQFLVCLINYEKFFDSLPHDFRRGRKKCDLIVYTKNKNSYFLLNELTSTNPEYDRNKATHQLKKSLTDLLSVQAIKDFTDSFTVKRCCFFNKQVSSPPSISAINAFNKINTVAPNGLQRSNTAIEELGFTFFKYYGEDQLILS